MNFALKNARFNSGKMADEVADAIGLSEDEYLSCENGEAKFPKSKFSKLAKFLNTDKESLQGRLVKKSVYTDENASARHYGEVAIHFLSKSEPLLLSISEAEFNRLDMVLEERPPFIVIRTLANQIVCVRHAAVSDIVFSSEAYDDYGPEHGTYNAADCLESSMVYWLLVEQHEIGLGSDEWVHDEDWEYVRHTLFPSDQYLEEMKASGDFPGEAFDKEVKRLDGRRERIFDLATKVKYGVSNGVRRELSFIGDHVNLYEAMCFLVDHGEAGSLVEDISPIELPTEGYHRSWRVDPFVLDFISIPAHQFQVGEVEAWEF